jgi:hypothetical protein
MFNSNKIIERIKRFKRDVSPRAFLVMAIALVVLLSGGVVVAASSAGTTQTQRTSAASGDNSSSSSSQNGNGVTQSSGTPTSGTSAPSNSSSGSTVKSSGGSNQSSGGSNKSSGGSGSTSGGSNSGSGGTTPPVTAPPTTTPPVTAPPTTTPPSNYIVADDGGFFAAYNSYCAANGCIQATAWRMSGTTNGINTGQCALTGSPDGTCGGTSGGLAAQNVLGTELFAYLSYSGLQEFTSKPGAVVTLYVGWARRYDLHGYLGYAAACIDYGTGQNCS